MDRQIAIGNRVIANILHQKQKRRLQQRIRSIKQSKSVYSQKGLIKEKRMNSFNLQKKYQLQKQNAGLFNRIASIIKQKPKIDLGSVTSLNRSRQTSILFHRKIQSSLEQQNKVMQNRLNNLKPTINNKLFYKQRAKNERYLKHMGKYPYILNKKIKTQPDGGLNEQNINNLNHNGTDTDLDHKDSLPLLSKINFNNENVVKHKFFKSPFNNTEQQLFKHQSLDFTIRVVLNHCNQVFSFLMEKNQDSSQKYKLSLEQDQFIAIFEQCEYDYEKMISKLRLDNHGNVYCLRQKQNLKTPKSDFIKFKPNSTGYTSNYTRNDFKTTHKNLYTQAQNQNNIPLDRQEINISKSQRKINNNVIKAQNNNNKGDKSERNNSNILKRPSKDQVALSQNKFAQICITQSKKGFQ